MSTASNSTLCPIPFLPLSDFPGSAGSLDGRLCAPYGDTQCCLPCPRQDWLYPPHFQTLITAATYFNLVSVASCLFLLISFWVLPVSATHRHYLSVCLVIAVLIMEIAFVIPFGSHDHQCLNQITPNDQSSSVVCALSGAALLAGGWCVVLWVFLRALSLHLQICWQVVPGRQFFIGSQIVGWAIPAAMVAVALSVTGVSFRFGDTCHINSQHGLASFWGPLLACAAGAIVTQFVTFGYCIQVYLRSLFEPNPSTSNSSLPTTTPTTNSIVTVTYTSALRRIRRVISLQWRGILIVIIIIADVVFFATVFLQFDGTTEKTPQNFQNASQWLECIILSKGDREKCYSLAESIVVPQATAITVLFLLSCNGIWVILLLGRWSMITGWADFMKGLFSRKPENDDFVSFNAARQPASFTQRKHTRAYTDLSSRNSEYKSGEDFMESYELGPSTNNSSIICRDSFLPNKKRSSSRLSMIKRFSGSDTERIISPTPDYNNMQMGYSFNISAGGPRAVPDRPKIVTSDLKTLKKSFSQRSTERSPEMEAVALGLAAKRSNSRLKSRDALMSGPTQPPVAYTGPPRI